VRGTRILATALLIAVCVGAGALTALAGTKRTADLRGDGIGTVRFGLSKAKAVAELSDLFGAPTWRGISTGCGARYTEVEWDDFAAEFRLNVFSGYRYATRLPQLLGAPRGSLSTVRPRLATAKGITVGSTLAQLHVVYGKLHWTGPDKRHASSGLFFVDDGTRSPDPPSSRIIEIKTTSTCGDY
jgi:hypothetical protein